MCFIMVPSNPKARISWLSYQYGLRALALKWLYITNGTQIFKPKSSDLSWNKLSKKINKVFWLSDLGGIRKDPVPFLQQ